METITFNDVKISFPQEQGVVIEQLNTIIQQIGRASCRERV